MAKIFRWLLMAAAAGGRRFAQIKARIGYAFRAGATAAPTVDGETKHAGGYGVAVNPVKVPVTDGRARLGYALGLLAHGENARIVFGRLWTGLYAGFRVAAAAIPAVAAAFREIWATALRAAAESVPTTSGSTVPAKQCMTHRMEAEAVETVLPSAVSAPGTAMAADAVVTETVEAGAAWQSGARLYAKGRTWMEPEVRDGVLYLRQAVEANVKDGILEVR